MAQTPSVAPSRTSAWRVGPSALLAGLLLVAPTAQAQPTGKAARPDPLDASAPVPALRYVTSLPVTRRAGDDRPISWRDANDTVTRIGGWRVYAREAQQPDPLPAAPTGQRP